MPRKEEYQTTTSGEILSVFHTLASDKRLAKCRLELSRQGRVGGSGIDGGLSMAVWEIVVYLPRENKIEAASYLNDFAPANRLKIDLRGERVHLSPPFEFEAD